MKFIHNETHQVYNGDIELRFAYPNTSFPPTLDSAAYEYCNVSVVTEVPAPPCNPNERVEYDGVKFIDGRYVDTWVIRPLYDDPTEQARVEAELRDTQLNEVRNKRQQLLNETDYLMLPDVPITDACRTAFVEYRQQLRNLLDEQNDPYNVVWPTKPDYIKSV